MTQATASGEAETAAPEPQHHQPRFGWVNAHGGAGASTLAAVLGGIDIGYRWPDPSQGEPGAVLLVARTHAAGLQAVSQSLDLFRQGELPPGVQVLAVVLVADAPGRIPRQLAQRIKIIGSVIAVHRVPWIPAWRTEGPKGPPPREMTALARTIDELTRTAGGA